MNTNELHDTIKTLKEYKLLKEEAEAMISELESKIKDEMRATEQSKMIVGEYKCSLATVTSNRVDTKALQEQAPDIYKAFAKSTTYERLTIR